MAEVYVQVRGA
uniref:Uncharacterized protein n=1 Tax=Anguilla anguilla TaxID=7936 RepID=A0A0E9Q135_ANGAN